MTNLTITENGFGYIKLTDETLKEFEVDVGTAGNLINNFNYMNEMIAWGFFSEDKNNDQIRGSIRSRGPVINEVLATWGGGGHALASGVRPKTFEETDKVIEALDEVCRKYNENNKDI